MKTAENLYKETDASSSPILGNPGSGGIGTLQQGALERSNVDVQVEKAQWLETCRKITTIQSLLDR